MTRRLSTALLFALVPFLLGSAPPARLAQGGRVSSITYVAIGDSTAVGVGASGVGYPQRLVRKLEGSGLQVKLLNLGTPGATAADARRDQLPKAMSSSPTLVTIGVGANDVRSGRTLLEFSRDLQIIADLVRRTKAVVVISTLPDLSLSPGAENPRALARRVEQFNAAIRTTAERNGLVVSDVWEASRRAARDREAAELYASDGVHPSPAGYAIWADALWETVDPALAPRVKGRRGETPERRTP